MSGTHGNNEDSNKSARRSARKLPDLSICQVKLSGIADLVCCCLLDDPSFCMFAERWAFKTFCFHPQRLEILAQNEA
jgi:hypothetical protein